MRKRERGLCRRRRRLRGQNGAAVFEALEPVWQ